MQLRHIRPGSMEWHDAMVAEKVARGWKSLAAEEIVGQSAVEDEADGDGAETLSRVRHIRERPGVRI